MRILLSKHSFPTVLLFLLLTSEIASPISVLAGKPQVINFRSPNLYPEGLAWDPSGQRFLVGSLRQRTISTVSDAGIIETLVSDTSLPENVTVLGLAVDSRNNRILAVLHAMNPLPIFNALAAYDLRSGHRVFLSLLPSATEEDGTATRPIANDVAVDYKGNVYVTNAADNYIWKVNDKGEASIFSKSPMFKAHPVDPNPSYSFCGLNGIAYVSKGYLLVAQTNTGKMFKVDEEDGAARLVLLNKDLMAADAVALRGDGVVLVVSPIQGKLWFLKSQDNWAQGVVFDEIDLDSEGFPTCVVAGEKERACVLYGRVDEGIKGNVERESFKIEVRSPMESEDENIWLYVLVGVGLAYFLFWKFQMGQLVKNMDKKIN